MQIPAEIAKRLLQALSVDGPVGPKYEGLDLWDAAWSYVENNSEQYEEMGG